MITNLLELFKVFSCIVVSIVPYSCSLRTKTLHIPQNLSNQIVLKVLYVKLQQNLEIYIYLNLCRRYAVKKVRSLTELCNINL